MIISSLDSIAKSINDKRQYRMITLQNSLRILLVHKPDLENTCVVLNVGVGLTSGPDDVPGLAPLLAHFLFRGHYWPSLSWHGRITSWLTTASYTSYTFHAKPKYLYGTLKCLARNLIAPLFNPSEIRQEMHAVNLECIEDASSYDRDISAVICACINPQHPRAKFGVDCLDVLANRADTYDQLISFYHRYYSANMMNLAIYGCEKLDQLASWADHLFSCVPNRKAVSLSWPTDFLPWINAGSQANMVCIKTKGEFTELHLLWQLPDMRSFYRTKPLGYIVHFLSHKGPGGILATLEAKGWAKYLCVNCSSTKNGFPLLSVTIELTKAGLAHYDDIILLAFSYISLIKPDDQQAWDECRRVNEVKFHFKNGPQLWDWTCMHSLGSNMRLYDPEHVLNGDYVMELFDTAAIRSAIEALGVDNFCAFLTTSQLDKLAINDFTEWKKEKRHGAEYAVRPLPAALIEKLIAPEPMLPLRLPPPNRFLPDDFRVLCPEAATSPLRKPRQLKPTLWYKLDDTYMIPKANLYVLFRTPDIYASAYAFYLAETMCSYIKYRLGELFYDATLAGLSYDIVAVQAGLFFRVSGFHDKLPKLFDLLLSELISMEIDESTFDIFRSEHWWQPSSWKDEQLYRIANECDISVSSEKYWTSQDQFACIDRFRTADLRQMIRTVFRASRPELLVHGNIDEIGAVSIHELLYAKCKPCVPDAALLVPLRAACFPLGSSIYTAPPIQGKECATNVILQIGNNPTERVLADLFAEIFRRRGYEADCPIQICVSSQELHGIKSLLFRTESESDPLFLEQSIEGFLEERARPFLTDAISIEEFERHKEACLVELGYRKGSSLEDETDVYWKQIEEQQFDFERVYTDVEIAKEASLAELQAFADRYVWRDAAQKRKMSVYLGVQTTDA